MRSCWSSSSGEESFIQEKKIKHLAQLMADFGLQDSVVEITEPRLQREVWGGEESRASTS